MPSRQRNPAKPGFIPDKPAGRLAASTDPEQIATPAEVHALIDKTQHLTDDAYEDLVNELGSRAALAVLRGVALSGDVRALDVYLRRTDDWRKRRAAGGKTRGKQAGNSEFVQGERVVDVEVVVDKDVDQGSD